MDSPTSEPPLPTRPEQRLEVLVAVCVEPGRPWSTGELAARCGRGPDEVAAAVAALVEAGVLVSQGDGRVALASDPHLAQVIRDGATELTLAVSERAISRIRERLPMLEYARLVQLRRDS